jgi:hypothetical protein
MQNAKETCPEPAKPTIMPAKPHITIDKTHAGAPPSKA